MKGILGRIDTASEKRLVVALALSILCMILIFVGTIGGYIGIEGFWDDFLIDMLAASIWMTVFVAVLLVIGVKRA